MVVPVGAYQIGQQFGIGGIGFGARDVVAVAIAGHRQRVDREHLIAGRGQRPHPQAAVGFDADHHLIGFLDVLGDQLVQLPDPGQPLGQPPRCQPLTSLVHQIHIVVVFRPVIAHEDHQSASLDPVVAQPVSSLRAPSGDLMDQCS